MQHLAPRNLVARPAEEGGVWILSPSVGLYVDPPRVGARLETGDPAGHLVVHQRAYALVLPAGVMGRAADIQPGEVHRPVEYGSRLFRLAPLAEAEDCRETAVVEGMDAALLESGYQVKAPLAGTFYRSPQPGAPPFVVEGDEVERGTRLCIIEAMKVMNLVRLGDLAGAPVRARVEAILVEDAAPVALGDLLMVVRRL
jgi:biotin carboxyl carrier protein